MKRYDRHLMIHRLAEDEKLSAKQIAVRLEIGVKTVARHLKSERYSSPGARVVSRKIDLYKDRIKQLLERHEYTAVQIFRILKDEGYPGGESVLRAYVAQVRPRRQKPYLILNFEPGSSAQVDFAECGLINVGETRRRLYAFVMTLGYSRMMFVKFIMRQNMEHFLSCHREAFEYFRGVTREIMVDNCKVAVKSPSAFGMPLINERYADCAAHYGFKVMPCGIRKANEKGVVERSIGFLRTSFLNGLDSENLTLAALNHGVRQWMENVANTRIHGTTRKTPVEMFNDEKAALLSLPLFPYDCGIIVNSRADKQYRVLFETNRYSVPPEFAGRRVELGVHPETLAIRCDGRLIAEHARSYDRNRDHGLAEHDQVLIEHRRKARQGLVMKQFTELGPVAETYYRGLQARRLNPATHVRKIMALSSVYGSEDLVRALEDASEAGAFGSDYIANILEVRRRVSPPPGPLHLSRKSDYLDLEIQVPDMNAYDIG
jgi:transposase